MFGPNPDFLKTEIRTLWSNKLKAFSISIWLKNHSSPIFATSIISKVNFPFTQMCLFWIEAVFCREVRLGKTSFNFLELFGYYFNFNIQQWNRPPVFNVSPIYVYGCLYVKYSTPSFLQLVLWRKWRFL